MLRILNCWPGYTSRDKALYGLKLRDKNEGEVKVERRN